MVGVGEEVEGLQVRRRVLGVAAGRQILRCFITRVRSKQPVQITKKPYIRQSYRMRIPRGQLIREIPGKRRIQNVLKLIFTV